MIEELEALYRETLEDAIFSRAERQALRARLKDVQLNKRQLDLLRSKIFDLARAEAKDHHHELLIQWLENANKTLLQANQQEAGKSRVFFSPGDDCLDAILAQVRGARQSIEICVFTISDNRISNELVDARNRGVVVKVITDNDKMDDAGSDIDFLDEKGIPVRIDRGSSHMHNKFAIFDGRSVLTGSYNWTRSAQTRNHENVLITEEPAVIKAYKKEFEELWEELMVL